MSSVRMIFVTVPDESVGVGLVTTLVEEGLVACGNLLPGVRSIYAWEGKICDEQELLLILKTTESLCTKVSERVCELHPYACPEVLSVAVEFGQPDYLAWVKSQVSSQK